MTVRTSIVWVENAEMEKMFSTAKLSACLASFPSADNRRRHSPTQFADALRDAEACPTLLNAISLPERFNRKWRVPSPSTFGSTPLL